MTVQRGDGVTELNQEADLSPAPTTVDGRGRLTFGGVCWSLFEGARYPFVTLITIHIFMPYVAQTVVGDPVSVTRSSHAGGGARAGLHFVRGGEPAGRVRAVQQVAQAT